MAKWRESRRDLVLCFSPSYAMQRIRFEVRMVTERLDNESCDKLRYTTLRTIYFHYFCTTSKHTWFSLACHLWRHTKSKIGFLLQREVSLQVTLNVLVQSSNRYEGTLGQFLIVTTYMVLSRSLHISCSHTSVHPAFSLIMLLYLY